MNQWLIIMGILVVFGVSDLHAQKFLIEGRCRDRHSHEQIQFVNLIIPQTGSGTSTDINGRFSISIASSDTSLLIELSHIAYEKRILSVGYLLQNKVIELQARMIPLEELAIYGERTSGLTSNDIPATVSVLSVRHFENKGFIDTGDILQADHSIQTNESVSGKKTITLRGGNADDVYVIHNGVRLNNNLNNEADVSNLDLSDVENIEIIKGSLTSLYGPDAVSGVINLVPKKERDYLVKFRQMVGPYRNGEWNLQFHKHNQNWYTSMGINQNGYARMYDNEHLHSGLRNRNSAISAITGYQSKEGLIEEASLFGMATKRSFTNYENSENILSNTFLSNFQVDFNEGILQQSGLQVAYRQQDENQQFDYSGVFSERVLKDKSLQTMITKAINLQLVDVQVVGQYEYGQLRADDSFQDSVQSIEDFRKTTLLRHVVGSAALIRLPFTENLEWLQSADVTASVRIDHVTDQIQTENNAFPISHHTNSWREGVFKLSGGFQGVKNGNYIKGYLNFGNSVKFPSLLHQVSTATNLESSRSIVKLDPERIQSFDTGFLLFREFRNDKKYSGWQFQVSFFKNLYQNKIRNLASPLSPVLVFDVTDLTDISGTDISGKFLFFENSLTIEAGSSFYNIPEKAAFPFKSERKQTVNIEYVNSGYQMTARWYHESEQVGWVRTTGQNFVAFDLPAYSNMDIHLSKLLVFGDIKTSIGLSARNILSGTQVFEAQVLRDQRLYLIFSIQY